MSEVGFFLDQETNSFIVSVLPQYLHFIIILCLSMISIVALISSSLFVTQFKFGQTKNSHNGIGELYLSLFYQFVFSYYIDGRMWCN